MAHTAKVLTIAVAAYNVAPYIAQCLDSFVDEKLLPALDIVVIDDGSTDATAHIVKNISTDFQSLFVLFRRKWWLWCRGQSCAGIGTGRIFQDSRWR